MIYENVIVSDVDGVMLLWENSFHRWMIENGYKPIVNDWETGHYEIHDIYKLDIKESKLLSKSFNESAALRRLPPLKDAIKYIRKLHEEHGYVFHCISAIPNTRDMYEARMENLENLFGNTVIERLTLCEASRNKKFFLKEYEGSGCFWIEDLGSNLQVGVEFGMQGLLMDRHYNRIPLTFPHIRVHNWKEIHGIITGNV